MKNRILLIGLIFFVACKNRDSKKTFLPPINERVPAQAVRVRDSTLPVSVEGSGFLSTEDEGKVSFKIGGVLSQILVDEGSFFKKGQLLGRLNTTEIDSKVSQALLGEEKARRDFERIDNLSRDSIATLEQEQNARTAWEVAKKTLDAARFDQHYAAIYAPFDGFVSQKLGIPGEVVAPGMPVLLINKIGSQQWVFKLGVTDKEWSLIKPGQPAVVELDGYAGQHFKAHVSRKLSSADSQNGTFQVELSLDAPHPAMAEGMFGKASIITGESQQVTVVPFSALVEGDGSEGYVYLLSHDSSLKKQPVHIFSFSGDAAFVQSGLTPGDVVVRSNSPFLNPLSKITIIP